MNSSRCLTLRWWFVVGFYVVLIPWPGTAADYAAVDSVLRRHCLDCHAAQEPEGGLVMETHEALMKGGESGRVIVPSRSAESLLVIAVEAGLLRDGRRKIMPPGKRAKLSAEEIAVLKEWIDAGALPPTKEQGTATRELIVPRIVPTVSPPRAIRATAYSPTLKQIALGRRGEVELVSADSRQVVRRLTAIRGAVNALGFSKDGRTLVVAAGEPARFGEATIWEPAEGRLVRTIEGHGDSLYAIALSPDGHTLATGGYDQKVRLWDLTTGALRHTFSAHNAAIFALAFRPDGKILASASGDRTVKLWQVNSGKRVETLSQPLKDVVALAWSPDGRRLAAGGADNRIRVWEISESAAETTNPLITSKFAHEGALLNVAWSADGRTLASSADDLTIKLWDASQMTERLVLERQPDLAPALAFLGESGRMVAGRMDGSWEIYALTNGALVPQPAPDLSHAQPRGIANGLPGTIKLFGTNLATVTNLMSSHPGLSLGLLTATSDVVTARVEAGLDVPRGAHDIWALGAGGASGRVKLYVDRVRSVDEARAADVARLPVAFWGGLTASGETDLYRFEARSNQLVVIELATKTVGSRMQNGTIALLDASGVSLGSAGGFDGADRIVTQPIPSDGTYSVRVSDGMLNGSAEHFYRLTVGELPLVTSVFPLTVRTNFASSVTLRGHHLPAEGSSVDVRAGGEQEIDLPVDLGRFRVLKPLKVLAVNDDRLMVEKEPNDRSDQANAFAWPGVINGRIAQAGDADLFRFEAGRGQRLVIETYAARLGSPVDTRIEVLDAKGRPVPRLLLQAVRNTAINFRGVDSNGSGLRLDHYEEMELNEYLYLNGDVMRFFRMPQGPDSDMMMYTSAGKRRAYFDTTPVAHALDETGFIVEPQTLGSRLVPNGLPVFTLHYENDDDAERKLGVDSRLTCNAPADGPFMVCVTDSRGHGGDSFTYGLRVREAKPGFNVSLTGVNPIVPAGSGQSFTVTAERLDGFEGEIRVEIDGLPPGFLVSSPLVIEADQVEAKGTLFAAADAMQPTTLTATGSIVTASARIDERTVTRPVNSLGTIQLGKAPKLYVGVEGDREAKTNRSDPATAAAEPLELTIAPGGTIPAWLKIQRNGHKELVTFFAENLPHGVIVADIGLNGVLIPKEENERQIFLQAARWVQPQERLFYLIEQQAGRQTSCPVRLKVRVKE